MTDELIVRARQNCCRLCLAPDNECVPIFTNCAADKEPLSAKILACVNIKVNESDRLSSRICHACISYLNSWQTFMNRCLDSQAKQINWLEMAKKTVRRELDNIRRMSTPTDQKKSKLLQHLTQTQQTLSHQRTMPAPIVIKTEPAEEDFQAHIKMDGQREDFLTIMQNHNEREDILTISRTDGPSNIDDGSPILSSLGLQQIKNVNPFNYLDTQITIKPEKNEDILDIPTTSRISTSTVAKALPACRVCKLLFSTRANARRHERNIHGKGVGGDSQRHRITMPKPTVLTPEMMGIFDYNNPEKYRYLLTDEKIDYIRRNEGFLKQYQILTCKCCNRVYSTYKQFMAHMRKKYPNLDRNTCFKCLKQFQSRAMYISHLKKKNCINLYQLYIAGMGATKPVSVCGTPDKVGTKDLLTNKTYECKLCKKEFRLKLDFRSHVSSEHSEQQRKDVAPGVCGFCGIEIEDPVIRRRHYNNMECIAVLTCGTCGEKFDAHNHFIEHVYQSHLPIVVPQHLASSAPPAAIHPAEEDLRLIQTAAMNESIGGGLNESAGVSGAANPNDPQNCKICGQRYNSYYNVIRHMESKHPDQLPKTYTCDKCDAGFPRQSSLRDHMLEAHGTAMPKSKRESLSCRMCPPESSRIETREKLFDHQTERHTLYACCYCNYDSHSLDDFKKHLEVHPAPISRIRKSVYAQQPPSESSTSSSTTDVKFEDYAENIVSKSKVEAERKECPICHGTFTNNQGLSNHMRSHGVPQPSRRELEESIEAELTAKQTPGAQKKVSSLLANSGFRRVRCRRCQKRFSTKQSYRRHMFIEHQIKDVTFIRCGVCRAEFTHKRGLKVHMFKVHGNRIEDVVEMEQFECQVCGTVYRTEEQLEAHTASVHGSKIVETNKLPKDLTMEPLYWYQCRYCPAHFDSNKKLAIHVNSHEEYDSNDYSCKDCGNVYSGRKSLWVHRYKKHPLIADPTDCVFCRKTFFDKNMLLLHLKTHTQDGVAGQIYFIQDALDKKQQEKEIAESLTYMAAGLPPPLPATTTSGQTHQSYEDESDEGGPSSVLHGSHENLKNLLPKQITCSVCSAPFSDQDFFDRHMKIHEMELYTDNPLASMFDTEPEDSNKVFMGRMGENGEYGCDICPKTFPMLTALKVHRNWHFRSDGKQIPIDPNSAWRANLPIKKRERPKGTQKCPYCPSSFINNSNLRRHIAELHKRETGKIDPKQVFIEKPLHCQKCNLTFQTNSEWVEHKINEVKTWTAESTAEWGCQICGKVVARKERLIQHMGVHLKNEIINGGVVSENVSGMDADELESNSSRSNTSKKRKFNTISYNFANGHVVGQEDGSDEEDEPEHTESPDPNSDDAQEYEIDDHETDNDDDEENRDEDDLENEEVDGKYEEQDDEDDEEYEKPPPKPPQQQYSCDLCQLFFETAKQLRKHVTSHFLNGPGSVTLTEIIRKPDNRTELTRKIST